MYLGNRRRPLIFQTGNYVRPTNLGLKYKRFDCKDKSIRKFELVGKNQFLQAEYQISNIKGVRYQVLII